MKLSRIAGHTFVWTMAGVVLLPLLWTLLNSFKRDIDLMTTTPLLVFQPTLDNLGYVLGRKAVIDALLNSVVVSLSAVAIGALAGLPAAYAVARYKNRWTEEIQFFVLSLRFLPPVAVAIPLVVIWLGAGLFDSRFALIVTYSLMTISVTIWLGVPAFERVPRAIEEAAQIDGYGPYSVFLKVALPAATSALMGAVAFSFVLVWNEFLLALMLTTSRAKTLPIVASELSQLGWNVPWGILNAAVVLLSLPPLLLLGVLTSLVNNSFSNKSR